MTSVQDSAIVLREYEYSETSQIIVFFTMNSGKVRAIAKGIKRGTKKRFAAGVDLLDIGQVTVRGRGERSADLAMMTEWKQTRCLSGLRESLHRLHGGQYVAEITAHLTEDWDPHPGLFEALLAGLTRLAESDEPFSALVGYQRALLDAVGSQPVFDRCVDCGRTTGLTHFSTFEGGMVCVKCGAKHHEKRPVRPETLAILRESGEGAASEGAFALFNHHIAHLIGKMPALAPKLLAPARLAPQKRGQEPFSG
jgi:DNA repair protein RecO (recombination protein O)